MQNKRILAFILSLLIIMPSCSSASSKLPKKAENDKSIEASQKEEKIIKKQEPEKKETEKKETDKKEENNKPDLSENKTQPSNPPSPSEYSNTKRSWYYNPNKTHNVPEVPNDAKTMLKKYSGYYVGDTSSKVIYLTFDEGYENGYTPKILDILKENDVKAAFFVTKPYITQQKDLIKRMVDEGHTVGNHSSTHPSMPSKASNPESFKKEFADTAKAFKDVTGKDMPMFFRPPMGEYSEKSLKMTQELGYKSIFWSFAHKDWETDNQPGANVSHDRVINGVHNGAIILLHAVSKSNTEALDLIIKDLKAQGYTFKTLEDLPQ